MHVWGGQLCWLTWTMTSSYFGFYDIAFTPLPIAYTVEIMPFSLRSKGMALFTATATLGNAFNQFVNPVALGAIGWK